MKHTQETKALAARMLDGGMTEVAVATALSVARSTLRTWFDPRYREARKATDTKRYKGPARKAQRAKLKDRKCKRKKYANDPDYRQRKLAATRKNSPTSPEHGEHLESSNSLGEKMGLEIVT